MNVIVSRFKEVLFSILPITAFVFILAFTLTPLDGGILGRFSMGAAMVIVGLTLFLLGVDVGITPLGNMTGSSLAKTNKLWLVLLVGLTLGFVISIAEPGLMVLANQVDLISGGVISSRLLILMVSVGLAIMLVYGFIRIIYNLPLYKILILLYLIIFGLALLVSREFLAISFDASGSTTGILAVPFILSLSVGISRLKKDSKASERDSFGLIAIASTGPIFSVMLLFLMTKEKALFNEAAIIRLDSNSQIIPFTEMLIKQLKDSFLAILPLVIILFFLQVFSLKLYRRDLRKILTGFVFSFIGLFLFLLGVNSGFMEVGMNLGNQLTLKDNKLFVILISFILGFVTILAEPAVHVLTREIEVVTSGYVKRRAVLISLAIGVGLSISLSMIKIFIPGIQLWHYLLPGYFISLILMFFVPKFFIGIAFDAGGVATGPVIATFILAFIQGAANVAEGANLLVDGFGMIALVAMTPIITLEILGLLYKIKSKRKGVVNDNE